MAHNPGGVEALVNALGEWKPRRPLHALVGILNDKDWRTMLQELRTVAERIWLTDPPTAPPDRRWNLQEVARESGAGLSVQRDFDRALREAQEGAKTILVTGSFHTVGDALSRLPGFAPLG